MKTTKKDLLIRLLELHEVQEDQELKGFVEKEIGLIIKKAETAKAKKVKEADTLKEIVYTCLTRDEYRCAQDILAEDIRDRDDTATLAKVSSRLGSLVKEGLVEKTQIKTEDGRRVQGYKLV